MLKLKYVERLERQKAISHGDVDEARTKLAAAQAATKVCEAKLQGAKSDVTLNKARIAGSEAIIKSAQARVQVAEADAQRAATLLNYAVIRTRGRAW